MTQPADPTRQAATAVALLLVACLVVIATAATIRIAWWLLP